MSLTINVGGMVCAACQAHVQKALDQPEGVSQAAVERLAREQAFSVLNRFAAIRMAE